MRLVNNHGPEVVGRELELVALGLHGKACPSCRRHQHWVNSGFRVRDGNGRQRRR